jgi:hypothetical protein
MNDYLNALTYDIPREFYEIRDYDKYNCLLNAVYVKMYDGSYKRTRMALLSNGCVFKLVNELKEKEEDVTTEYRAYDNPQYDKKLKQVVIKCTTLKDYLSEVNMEELPFIPPTNEICRRET